MELTYRAEPKIQGCIIAIDEFESNPRVVFDYSINQAVERHTRQIIDTRDQIIRDALILLGWTPPPPVPHSNEGASIESTRRRVRANDPLTSIDAAERAEKFAGSHQERILRALSDYALSTHQIATRAGLTVVQVDRRIHELKSAGRIGLVVEGNEPVDRCGYLVYRRIRSSEN